MRDILPPESARWRRFVHVFAQVAERAGYGQIISPLLEDLGVFQRIGAATDVVSKEMYDFVDKGGRHVALRPELTASVCRAFVQHRPTTPWKVWYTGSQFRYEKPQRGRYRQFDQVGIEVLGADDPYLDVEVIALGWEFYRALGLQQVLDMGVVEGATSAGLRSLSQARANGTILLSFDEGRSWPVRKRIVPGSFGYSNMDLLPDESVLIVYENATGTVVKATRFTLDWLTQPDAP